LRTVLALVYVWFGLLKVIGHSDVFGLVQATIPCSTRTGSCRCWVDRTADRHRSGHSQARRIALVGVVAHLAGTFLTFIDAPSWMMHNGNLLLLNMDGEFVLKNLVLISAAVVLLGMTATSSSIRLGGIRLSLRRQPSAGSEIGHALGRHTRGKVTRSRKPTATGERSTSAPPRSFGVKVRSRLIRGRTCRV